MSIIYSDADEMFEVLQDGDRYFLVAVVGGIAMYEVRREMSAEMVEQFYRDPQRLLWWVDKIRKKEE